MPVMRKPDKTKKRSTPIQPILKTSDAHPAKINNGIESRCGWVIQQDVSGQGIRLQYVVEQYGCNCYPTESVQFPNTLGH
jgi:hypothetical protein